MSWLCFFVVGIYFMMCMVAEFMHYLYVLQFVLRHMLVVCYLLAEKSPDYFTLL